jgi:hypothetical protein
MEIDISEDFDKSLANYFYLLNFKQQSLFYLSYKFKSISAIGIRSV